MGIVGSTKAYEAFLRAELGEEVVEEGLEEKHRKMAGEGAFPFLRATYWRWAERIPAIAGDLAAAPAVLAVGDTHLENFGTWRDADGRLVWGVNDYDEAAEMPYGLCHGNRGPARESPRHPDVHHAAAVAARHCAVASARNVRSVQREIRWRWTLKVL